MRAIQNKTMTLTDCIHIQDSFCCTVHVVYTLGHTVIFSASLATAGFNSGFEAVVHLRMSDEMIFAEE